MLKKTKNGIINTNKDEFCSAMKRKKSIAKQNIINKKQETLLDKITNLENELNEMKNFLKGIGYNG